MANNYYTQGSDLVPGTTARATDVNAELSAIEVGLDLLPTNVTDMRTNRAVFAIESGSGNAFVVTMRDTRTIDTDGDEIAFFATHGNTGAATLNVDGIGAKSIRDHAEAVLTSGAIVSGRMYTVRYKASAGYFVIATSFGTFVAQTNVTGTSTDNPETAGVVTFNANLVLQNANSLPLALIGYEAGKALVIRNHVWDGEVQIHADNSAGAQIQVLTAGISNSQVVNQRGNLERVLTVLDREDVKVKPNLQSTNTDIALSNDTDLAGWPLLPGGTIYRLKGRIFFTEGGGGIRCAFALSGAIADSNIHYQIVNTATDAQDFTTLGDITSEFSNTTAAAGWIDIDGYIETTGSAVVTLDFQWAQQVSNGANTTLELGCWMSITIASN